MNHKKRHKNLSTMLIFILNRLQKQLDRNIGVSATLYQRGNKHGNLSNNASKGSWGRWHLFRIYHQFWSLNQKMVSRTLFKYHRDGKPPFFLPKSRLLSSWNLESHITFRKIIDRFRVIYNRTQAAIDEIIPTEQADFPLEEAAMITYWPEQHWLKMATRNNTKIYMHLSTSRPPHLQTV